MKLLTHDRKFKSLMELLSSENKDENHTEEKTTNRFITFRDKNSSELKSG